MHCRRRGTFQPLRDAEWLILSGVDDTGRVCHGCRSPWPCAELTGSSSRLTRRGLSKGTGLSALPAEQHHDHHDDQDDDDGSNPIYMQLIYPQTG